MGLLTLQIRTEWFWMSCDWIALYFPQITCYNCKWKSLDLNRLCQQIWSRGLQAARGMIRHEIHEVYCILTKEQLPKSLAMCLQSITRTISFVRRDAFSCTRRESPRGNLRDLKGVPEQKRNHSLDFLSSICQPPQFTKTHLLIFTWGTYWHPEFLNDGQLPKDKEQDLMTTVTRTLTEKSRALVTSALWVVQTATVYSNDSMTLWLWKSLKYKGCIYCLWFPRKSADEKFLWVL